MFEVISPLLALTAASVGLLVILLYGRLVSRTGEYQLGRLLGSWYFLIPFMLAVLNYPLGILSGGASALLAHRRGIPEQRNFVATFSLILLSSVLLLAALYA